MNWCPHWFKHSFTVYRKNYSVGVTEERDVTICDFCDKTTTSEWELSIDKNRRQRQWWR